MIIDEPIVPENNFKVTYAPFSARFWAMVTDAIILAVVAYVTSLVSSGLGDGRLIPIGVSLLALVYQPYMEYIYGATLGKMALQTKVVNLKFQKSDLQTILLRNMFNIAPQAIVLAIYLVIVINPGLEFPAFFNGFYLLEREFTFEQLINLAFGALSIAEGFMVLSDAQGRSLHDRIAGTYVVTSVKRIENS